MISHFFKMFHSFFKIISCQLFFEVIFGRFFKKNQFQGHSCIFSVLSIIITVTTFGMMAIVIFSSNLARADFILSSPEKNACVVVGSKEENPLRRAAEDLISDVKKITGRTLSLVAEIPSDPTIPYVVIRTVPTGHWERYSLKTVSDRCLEITGSDSRGAMFGIYDFLENDLGVDPYYFWTDRLPDKRDRIAFSKIDRTNSGPTVKYRGWFINDEDLLTKWRQGGGTRQIDYPFYGQVVHPEIMERIVETLLRARFNMIIPASFLDIMNPAEEKLVRVVAERGVFISQHHIEPLGVSAFSFFNYWKKKNGTRPAFSWFSSKKELLEVWNCYAKKWSEYPNVIWQIGLRGIADRPMWLADPKIPQSDADRGALIADAMKIQSEIVRKYDRRPEPPMTATLWMEGSFLLEKGFTKPPRGTILVFADNCPGWKMQRDFYSVARDSFWKYGIYYHQQLWGTGPHLAQGIPPRQTWLVLREALKYPATDLVIANVSNIREFVLGIDATSKMLWDLNNSEPDSYLKNWSSKYYPSAADEIFRLYGDYFRSFMIHPETKTPFLLDGQIKSAGRSILGSLRKKVARSEKSKTEKASGSKQASSSNLSVSSKQLSASQQASTSKSQQVPGSKPVASSISATQKEWTRMVNVILADMHPRTLEPEKNLLAAQAQFGGFDSVCRKGEVLLGRLTETEQRFLKTNLLAPAIIMRALSQWYEELLQAQMVMKEGNRDQCVVHLKKARDYLSESSKAVEILTTGEKWKYWYRGEEKLNLTELIKLTERTTMTTQSK